MQALKTIVISLGAALVVGFGLLIYGLTQNWHRLTEAPKTSPSRNWGEVVLGGTGPATIRGMTAVEGRLVVQIEEIERGAPRTRLVVLDPASGAMLGSFIVPGAQ